MSPITFYPGPSKVYPQVAQYMQEAYQSGILSVNHRSAPFMEICRKTIELTKSKLSIPQDYTLIFVSSATESWAILAQSLVKKQSFHLYNGAFGQKWMEYSQKIHPQVGGYNFDVQEKLQPEGVEIPASAEIICLTQNETSNGTQVSNEVINAFKQKYPSKLIAVDATSSIGGIILDFAAADIWFGSVQKCLGLPAGLGLLICSPSVVAKAREIGDNRYYNSFLFLYDNIQKFQTSYTPNVLGIYLLMKVMENVEPITKVASRIKGQAEEWYAFLDGLESVEALIENREVRSDTVVVVKGKEGIIKDSKERAKGQGIVLGNGYGLWKETTFRLANFPAITEEEIQKVKEFLAENLNRQ